MITNKIKEYRKIKNMTQEELAIELGVSRKTLSLIESGSVIPKVDAAYKLSLILEATIEELFYNDEYINLNINEIEEKAHEIVKNIVNIVNKLSAMPIDARKNYSKMLEYFEKLEYMFLCISIIHRSKLNNEVLSTPYNFNLDKAKRI